MTTFKRYVPKEKNKENYDLYCMATTADASRDMYTNSRLSELHEKARQISLDKMEFVHVEITITQIGE